MKVASIDIGSNTVLLLIAEIELEDKKLIPLLNVYRMPRISKGINESKIISASSISNLLEVLSEYKILIERHNCSRVIVNATQALRVAQNSEEIISAIKAKIEFDVNVIAGNDEAYLSFIGAQSGFDLDSSVIVIDIGGASTEIVLGSNTNILFQKSFPIGVVTMTEKYLEPPITDIDLENLEEYISVVLKELADIDSTDADVIAVAGTPTTLACAMQNLLEYSDEKVEGFKLNKNDLNDFISVFRSISSQSIRNKYGEIMNGREDIILAGTVILHTALNILGKESLNVSGRGLRYGAIIDFMTSKNKG